MKNWSTDAGAFRTKKEKRAWELAQMINYGTDGTRFLKKELVRAWPAIKPHIAPERTRMIEYLLWGVISSPPINDAFWSPPVPRKTL